MKQSCTAKSVNSRTDASVGSLRFLHKVNLLVRLVGCHPFRIWSVLIVPGRAVLHHENKQHDGANDGHERNEQPPSTAVSVVKTPHGDSKTWNEDAKRINAAQQPSGTHDSIYYTENETDNNIEQHKIPVLSSPGPALKYCIFLQNLKIPVQTDPSFFSLISQTTVITPTCGIMNDVTCRFGKSSEFKTNSDTTIIVPYISRNFILFCIFVKKYVFF